MNQMMKSMKNLQDSAFLKVLGNGYGLDTLITSKYDKLMKQTLLSVCNDEKPISTTKKKKQPGKIRLIPFDCSLLKLPIDIFSVRRKGQVKQLNLFNFLRNADFAKRINNFDIDDEVGDYMIDPYN